jgi:hypothetical protein
VARRLVALVDDLKAWEMPGSHPPAADEQT